MPGRLRHGDSRRYIFIIRRIITACASMRSPLAEAGASENSQAMPRPEAMRLPPRMPPIS